MIMAGALSRGLTMADFNNLYIGQIIDYCITYNNLQNGDEEVSEKTANQSDFDRF